MACGATRAPRRPRRGLPSPRRGALGRRLERRGCPPLRYRRDACDGAPCLSGWQAAMGASCFASAAALDRRVVVIATRHQCDVLPAPLRFRGHRYGSLDSIALAAALLSNVDARAATLRFSQFRLKLDQRTRHGPHRCAVQSKVARAVARCLSCNTLAAGAGTAERRGPGGTSDAIRRRETAADTACRCW